MRIPLRALQAAARFAASKNRDVEITDFLAELPPTLPDSLLLKADNLRKELPCVC